MTLNYGELWLCNGNTLNNLRVNLAILYEETTIALTGITKRKLEMKLSLKTTCIKHANAWGLYQLRDGSYLVIHDRDMPENPNKVIGLLGRWINTDDRSYAIDLFDVLYKTVIKGQDDAEATGWRATVERLVCSGARN